MKQKCEICGKEFTNLGVHVNKSHRIPMDEYRKMYPTNSEGKEIVRDLAEGEEIAEKEFKANAAEEAVEVTKLDEADEYLDMMSEAPVEAKVTNKEIRDGIFGKEETFSDKPLSDFLEKFDISEKELRAIVRQYKTGSSVPVSQQLKQKEEIGLSGAEKLKNKEKVETYDLHIAEALTTKYGFECITVRSRKGNTPKTWVLRKIK